MSDEIPKELLFTELLRHMPDAIYFKDRSGRFLAASDYTARIFGLESGDSLVGHTDFDFFSADQAKTFREDEQRIMASGEPIVWKDEREFMRDGRERWFSTTKVPFRDKHGEIIGILGISRDETERMRAEIRLQKQDRELREHLGRIKGEVERARLVQQMLLPAEPPTLANGEIAVRSQPMEAVGGDYWSFPDLGGGESGIFLGDLTGHGVSAALYMTLVRFVCDRYWSRHGKHPCRLLGAVNGDLQNQMPGAFLTAIYGVVKSFDDGVAVRLAAAGHPRPLLLRADGRASYVELDAGAALALFEDFVATEKEIFLRSGDTLIIYTDGITESLDAEERMFGDDGLLAVAQQLVGRDAASVAEGVLEAAGAWRGEARVNDDAVAIAITVS